VQHELRKRIFARFRSEGISIPFPQRDVHIFAEGNSNWMRPEMLQSSQQSR
jgi:small-conductance mechanosensitive channel